MNKKGQRIKYVIYDLLAGGAAYVLFYIFRKVVIEPKMLGYEIPVHFTGNFYIGILTIPIFWGTLHLLSGYYRVPIGKSRLHEFGQTFFTTLVGVIVLFFVLMLDDWVESYKNYYTLFLVLFCLQFFLTYIPRLINTTIINHKIHKRELTFNTLIIGSNKKAVNLYEEIENQKVSSGYKFIGFLNVYHKDIYLLSQYLEHLGELSNLNNVIEQFKIEEVVIAVESNEHCKIRGILTQLQGVNIDIKVIPDMYDILIGKVRMTSILGTPLIQIHRNIMPVWQVHTKRLIDILGSLFALIILSPLYLTLAILVKTTSKGPALYSHTRIGKNGKPFTIYKFRSMVQYAEKNNPLLSSKNDSRVTKIGKFLRKTRLDELPQFYNVLKGDMSIVGPRPERQYFIDMIVEKAPHYIHLQRVRPGITSWGQVKFGYAENVDEMIQRLKYDIIYIENMSLYIDFKIMIYTIKIIFQGKGV